MKLSQFSRQALARLVEGGHESLWRLLLYRYTLFAGLRASEDGLGGIGGIGARFQLIQFSSRLRVD